MQHRPELLFFLLFVSAESCTRFRVSRVEDVFEVDTIVAASDALDSAPEATVEVSVLDVTDSAMRDSSDVVLDVPVIEVATDVVAEAAREVGTDVVVPDVMSDPSCVAQDRLLVGMGGRCVANLLASTMHCGCCGNACAAEQRCLGGVCGADVDVATTTSHTCLREGNEVRCWGDNSRGQLGTGDRVGRIIPPLTTVRLPSGVASVQQLEIGYLRSCALSGDGRVFCWGADLLQRPFQDGASPSDQLTPTFVPGLPTITQLASSRGEHTCAISSMGQLFCWGENGRGELGVGDSAPKTTVQMVRGLPAGRRVRIVAVGYRFTCAGLDDSSVWCWGDNSLGQLGTGTVDSIPHSVPAAVPGLGEVVQISAHNHHACALGADARVRCWGRQEPITGADRDNMPLVPTLIRTMAGTLQGVAQLSTSWETQCVRMLPRDGVNEVRCWGFNNDSQLLPIAGAGAFVPFPTAIPGLPNDVLTVSKGDAHTCVYASGRQLWCWGRNSFGQVGNGTRTPPTMPVRISLP